MRRKDRYIGRLYLYIGKVPSGSGIFPEYREVTGIPRGKSWALWAMGEKKEGKREGVGKGKGGATPLP